MADLRVSLPSYLPLVHCPRFARVTVARYDQSRGPAESQGTVGSLLGILGLGSCVSTSPQPASMQVLAFFNFATICIDASYGEV